MGVFPKGRIKKRVYCFLARKLALNMIIATLGTWVFPPGRSNVITAELLFQSRTFVSSSLQLRCQMANIPGKKSSLIN